MKTACAAMFLVVFAACGEPASERRAARSAEPSPSPSPSPSTEPTPTPRPDPFKLALSYQASSPKELADRLTEAEAAFRANTPDPSAHARVQQALYRQLVVNHEWRDEVIKRLPPTLRPVAQANIKAGVELRALTKPRTELPPWHILQPPPASELRRHYDAAAKEFGVGWEYLAAIHLTETRMGRIRGDSIAGARGPMQFLPSTWDAWGEGNIENPRDAIRAAARYLKGHGAPGSMSKALFAYNHSDHYVTAIEIYADQMRTDPRTYNAYYHWQVYYRTTKGDALLYEGWPDK